MPLSISFNLWAGKFTEQNLSEGLKSVVTNTNLLGRWQNLSVEPDIYCDVAHNADGFKVLFEHLNTETFNRLYIVFGVMKDKDLDAIFATIITKCNLLLLRGRQQESTFISRFMR